METFGSSLVFVWLKLWNWFGYSLVTVQEFGLSKWLPSMPLVVRGWAASLRAIPHFGIETTHEEEYQKCNSVGLWSASGTGRWGLWLVTTSQVCDSVTPPWRLQMIGSSAGQGSAQEWKGSGVRGRGHRELGHILAPERTNSNIFLELRDFFLKQERGYIFIHFFLFLFFFSEVLVLSLRKSPSEVSIHNEVTF